jgi:uncharacterized protein DUF87
VDGLGAGLFWIVIIGSVVGIGVFRAYLRSQREREQRREIDESRRQRREAEEASIATAMWLEIRDAFPFLKTPTIEEPTADKIYDAAAEILYAPARWGTIAGTRLPVPALPADERRRHFYVVGKTGSGKSTFLERLIATDLEEGRGVGVISPEGEFFRERLLPLIPETREDQVIYFAPGHPKNPLTFNPLAIEPGEDPVRAAEDLFTIFKRAISEDELGARMQPIIQNAFAALVGQPGMTLWEVKRLLEDAAFRKDVMQSVKDPYVQAFWLETYPRFPKGADLPIVNRLDQFLRPPAMRKTLCHPASSFSIRDALAKGRILLLDLFGLSEENRLLIGQMLLSKFQLELMRRELTVTGTHAPFYLYADEFQSFAGVSEGTWRELLSRGRKYGVCLTLAHQYPAQLPTGLQDEILGNANSIVSFALGGKDAQVMRREFLQKNIDGHEERLESVPAAALIELATGEAYAKFAGGRAIRIVTPPPMKIENVYRAEEVIAGSWNRHGTAPTPEPPRRGSPKPPDGGGPRGGKDFLE